MDTGPTEWHPKDSLSAEAVIKELKVIAPSFCFEAQWDRDESYCDAQGCYLHDVVVTVYGISKGDLYFGASRIASIHAKPEDEDPDIHGNLPQMVEDALEDIPWESFPNSVQAELKKASKYIHSVIVRRGERQQRRKGVR